MILYNVINTVYGIFNKKLELQIGETKIYVAEDKTMLPTIKPNDLILAKQCTPEDLNLEDIIIFDENGIIKEAEENAAADAKRKEDAETINKADGMIFQTEKQLKEFGEKLSADKKAAIEAAHTELKAAYETKDADAIKPKLEALDAAWMAASEELYKATQEAQPQPEQTQGNAGENVQDADFEEVK
jgi:hypothetical protein